MATTGEVFPSSAVTASEGNWSDNDWVNPTNIFSDNGVVAEVTAATYDSPDQTFVLKAYGFNFSSIPDGSTINGVTCRINAYYSAGGGSLDLLQLLDVSRAKVGTNQCSTPVALTTTTSTVITKGSSSDLWGNSLTAAWVKDPDFGVAIGILATAANADVHVDYVTLEITYTAPLTHTQTDTEGLSDSGVVRDFTGTATSALGLSDSVSTQLTGGGGTNYTQDPTDTEGLTDAVALDVGLSRTDDEALTDAIALDLGLVRTDSEGLTDTASLEVGLNRTDDEGLTDTASLEVGLGREDSLGLTDALDIVKGRLEEFTDTEGLTDSVALDIGLVRTDDEGLTDSLALDQSKVLGDTEGLSDAGTVRDFAGTGTDNLGLTDSVTTQLTGGGTNYTVGITDSTGLTDASDALDGYSWFDFESGITGWVGSGISGGGSVTHDTTTAGEGTGSLKLTKGTSPFPNAQTVNATTGDIPVPAGPITITFWAKASLATECYLTTNNDGPTLFDTFDVTTTWQQFRLPFTFAGAFWTKFEIGFNDTLPATGDSLWVDGFQILTDLVTIQRDMAPSRTDDLGLTDTVSPAIGFGRSQDDTLGLTDTLEVLKGAALTQSDSENLTDSLALAYGHNPSDTVGLTDQVTTTSSYVRTQDDLVGLTDSITASLTSNAILMTIDDSMAMTDIKVGTHSYYQFDLVEEEPAHRPHETAIDRMSIPRGVTLWKDSGGTWHQGRHLKPLEQDTALVIYRGGYENHIDPVHYLELQAAGFGVELVEVTF